MFSSSNSTLHHFLEGLLYYIILFLHHVKCLEKLKVADLFEKYLLLVFLLFLFLGMRKQSLWL